MAVLASQLKEPLICIIPIDEAVWVGRPRTSGAVHYKGLGLEVRVSTKDNSGHASDEIREVRWLVVWALEDFAGFVADWLAVNQLAHVGLVDPI